jgi:hypothetical protein
LIVQGENRQFNTYSSHCRGSSSAFKVQGEVRSFHNHKNIRNLTRTNWLTLLAPSPTWLDGVHIHLRVWLSPQLQWILSLSPLLTHHLHHLQLSLSHPVTHGLVRTTCLMVYVAWLRTITHTTPFAKNAGEVEKSSIFSHPSSETGHENTTKMLSRRAVLRSMERLAKMCTGSSRMEMWFLIPYTDMSHL